jgi:hypothetical protein
MALQLDSPSLVNAGFMDNGEAMNCEKFGSCAIAGENAHIDHPIALQTDHPKLLFFQRV